MKRFTMHVSHALENTDYLTTAGVGCSTRGQSSSKVGKGTQVTAV